MAALEDKHIAIGFDGLKWIRMSRKKTGRIINVPLLPKALEILKLYENGNSLLPVISNQRFKLLYNNVPMEIVSELLGHSNMSITQEYYGKIVMKNVSEEMKKLNRRI